MHAGGGDRWSNCQEVTAIGFKHLVSGVQANMRRVTIIVEPSRHPGTAGDI